MDHLGITAQTLLASDGGAENDGRPSLAPSYITLTQGAIKSVGRRDDD